MKITRTLTLGALAAAAAFAQTTGTITITGSIPDSISMTNSANTPLSTTVSLGALVAANSSTLATLATPIDVLIRSNKAFNLNAQCTFSNTGAGADDGGFPITANDIGFGITALAAGGTGASVVGGPTRSGDTIVGRYNYITTPFASLPVTNGKTPFNGSTHATLAEISTATSVMDGIRISKLGNIQSDDNFIKVSFNVATLPQYFSPTTAFSALITLTPSTL